MFVPPKKGRTAGIRRQLDPFAYGMRMRMRLAIAAGKPEAIEGEVHQTVEDCPSTCPCPCRFERLSAWENAVTMVRPDPRFFTELKHWVFSSGVGQSPNWKWCPSLPHVSAEDTREVVGTLADVAVGLYGSKCSASQMVDMVGIKYDKILHLGSSSVPTFGLSLRVDSQAEFTVQPGQCSIHE